MLHAFKLLRCSIYFVWCLWLITTNIRSFMARKPFRQSATIFSFKNSRNFFGMRLVYLIHQRKHGRQNQSNCWHGLCPKIVKTINICHQGFKASPAALPIINYLWQTNSSISLPPASRSMDATSPNPSPSLNCRNSSIGWTVGHTVRSYLINC